MSDLTVYNANMIAALVAERAPNLGEAATMAVMEALLEAKTIGADYKHTPRHMILAAVDKAAAPYRTHTPPDPAEALDQEIRDRIARRLGADALAKAHGLHKLNLIAGTRKIILDERAKATVGGREQRFLDSFEHVADLELTPAQRMTQGDLRALDQRDAAAKAAKAAPADAAPVKGDAMTRLDSANRSNQIAKFSRELIDAKAAIVNHKDNRNLVSYAENRVVVLTAKLADLGVTVS